MKWRRKFTGARSASGEPYPNTVTRGEAYFREIITAETVRDASDAWRSAWEPGGDEHSVGVWQKTTGDDDERA